MEFCDPTFDIGAGPFSASVLDVTMQPTDHRGILRFFSPFFDSQNQGRLAKFDAFGALDIGYLTGGCWFSITCL
jgi:hypothetical protein